MPTKERRAKAKARAAERVVKVEVPLESEPESERPTEEQRAADDDLAQLDADNPRAPYVVLYRVNRRTGQRSRIAKLDTAIVDGDFVTEEFGGGKFFGKKYRPGTKSGFEYDGTINFDIDETLYPPKIPSWLRHESPVTGPVTTPSPASSNIIDAGVLQLFTAMQQTSQMQGQMMQAFIERMANQPQTNWVEVMAALGPIGAAVLKMLTDRKDPAAIAAELLDKIKPKGDPAPTGAVAEAFGLFDRFLSIQGRLAPRGVAAAPVEPDDSLVGFLKTMAPGLLQTWRETLEARRQAAVLAAGRSPAAPNGNGATAGAPPASPPVLGATMVAASPPAIAAPTASAPLAPVPTPAASKSAPTPSPGDANLPVWVPFVRPWIPQLVQWLAAEYYPETIADLLLKAIDKEGRLPVAEPMLMDPNFPAALMVYFPALEPYAELLGQTFEAIREDLSPDDTDGRGDAGSDEEIA